MVSMSAKTKKDNGKSMIQILVLLSRKILKQVNMNNMTKMALESKRIHSEISKDTIKMDFLSLLFLEECSSVMTKMDTESKKTKMETFIAMTKKDMNLLLTKME